METIVVLLGRYNTGIVLVLIGVTLVAQGIAKMRPSLHTQIGMQWFQGFRRTAIGFGVTAIGAAGLWQQPWLLAVGMGVGLGETMECSFVLSVLTHEQRHSGARTQ